MCGTTTDSRFAHNYIPDGKTREVTCAHTTAEACYAHEKVLGTSGVSKKVQELLDWAEKKGYLLSDLGNSLG
jgi:hypothetical protein